MAGQGWSGRGWEGGKDRGPGLGDLLALELGGRGSALIQVCAHRPPAQGPRPPPPQNTHRHRPALRAARGHFCSSFWKQDRWRALNVAERNGPDFYLHCFTFYVFLVLLVVVLLKVMVPHIRGPWWVVPNVACRF